MSRSSTSNLAMALAGSKSSNAAVVPPSLHDVKLSSFSTTAAAASKTQSMDIPKSRHGYGKPGIANKKAAGLPTPPNSVSPTLYPLSQERETFHRKAGAGKTAAKSAGVTAHNGSPYQSEKGHAKANANGNGSKDQLGLSPSSQRDIDSDIDLQEAVEHAHAQSQTPYRHRHLLHRHRHSQHQAPHHQYQQPQSLSEITPESLAAYHIPEILLNEGPLAIRHIIARLNQRIPEFSRIPPAKARRVVAAALEENALEKNQQIQQKESMARTTAGEDWDAPTTAASTSRSPPLDHTQTSIVTSSESSSSSFAQSIFTRLPPGRHVRSSSITTMAESATTAFSYTGTPETSCLRDRCNAMSREVNKTSFGYEYDDITMDDDEEDERYDRGSVINDHDDDDDLDMDWNEADDMTDEEDWEQIGADALRARSYGMSPPTHMMTSASGPDPRAIGLNITGQSGIVPLRAQQAIAEYQYTARSYTPNARRQLHMREGMPMTAGRANCGGFSFDFGYGESRFNAPTLAKSVPTISGARGPAPVPIAMMRLKPEEKEQLAGSGPEERAAVEALLRLGSTPV
ncbi:Sin3 binding protein [Ascosphaera apis ARSEF 7405]|uniref:Sin3 binding protein n=1 Tax=Ascosphaera apis ARSEF 7405 TaxID=392613 RepID=A0A167VIT4_9EURO|nr:Sin3 binding protein [Ascosphaera apis ARSEF 7405]